ncbi:hypothetical protein GCM10023092_27760 [Rurimicrobium arvi]|uniref:Uncharacterized protein n=1 Tax=Rurimicrobium arvi TaxID=2049916 RepID=A0ABP8N353_9BACT
MDIAVFPELTVAFRWYKDEHQQYKPNKLHRKQIEDKYKELVLQKDRKPKVLAGTTWQGLSAHE